jgi:hypothetical protein
VVAGGRRRCLVIDVAMSQWKRQFDWKEIRRTGDHHLFAQALVHASLHSDTQLNQFQSALDALTEICTIQSDADKAIYPAALSGISLLDGLLSLAQSRRILNAMASGLIALDEPTLRNACIETMLEFGGDAMKNMIASALVNHCSSVEEVIQMLTNVASRRPSLAIIAHAVIMEVRSHGPF